MFQVHWLIFLEVKNEQKAERILKKIETVLGRTLVILESAKYWKIDNYWKIRFEFDLNAEDFASAIFETLNLCDGLSSHWDIVTPQIYENGNVEFIGVTNKNLRIVGLKMVDFYMKTKQIEN